MPRFRRCSHWKCGRCKKENSGHYRNSCQSCNGPKSEGTSLQRYPGEWTCKSCSYINFSYRGLCHGCSKPRNWIPETEEEKEERVSKEAERKEVARLKHEESIRKVNERARELGWPDNWDWKDLTDEQLLDLM